MTKVVLVLGASGLFGSHVATAFGAAGWDVRRYQRGTDMNAAAMGADVIVNGLNPPMYHDWARLIPQITKDAIAAAKASGATLLVPGNVYVYGREPGLWGPDTPQRPASRKGAIRVTMEADYRAAAAAGTQVIVLRGGDFLAPDQPQSYWNMMVLKYLPKGRIVTPTGLEVKRAYAYLPDMARAAVALAERRTSLPAFADVPFAGLTLSLGDVKAAAEVLVGRSLKVSGFPWWAMTLAAPFWELARELREMRYLYDHSHALDPEPLQALLPGFRTTPFDTVLREHVAHLMPQGSAMVTQTGR
jgi:nucleoside-diphosphate-sugar epimerase